MKFHYEFDIKPIEQPIQHQHKIMLLGSCFTENIAEKLRKHKFEVLENPNGILFNPVSVAEAIINITENKQYTVDDLFHYNEGWHSWQHHSRFSGVTPEEALAKINASTLQAHQFIQKADYLLITLGSAWIYTLTDKAFNGKPGIVAANNHKAPADWFVRKLMDIGQVITVLLTMLDRVGAINPNINVIFTISPVRHLREGVIDNNRSKATLITAVHHIVDKLSKLYYFPAYELVIDDLRDYRFYAEDLVHPNYHATQYVWNKFVQACISQESQQLLDEIAAINLAYNHKPFNQKSQAHAKFLQNYHEKTLSLQKQHPYLSFQQELDYFSNK